MRRTNFLMSWTRLRRRLNATGLSAVFAARSRHSFPPLSWLTDEGVSRTLWRGITPSCHIQSSGRLFSKTGRTPPSTSCRSFSAGNERTTARTPSKPPCPPLTPPNRRQTTAAESATVDKTRCCRRFRTTPKTFGFSGRLLPLWSMSPQSETTTLT